MFFERSLQVVTWLLQEWFLWILLCPLGLSSSVPCCKELQWEWKGFIFSLFLRILVRKKKASPGLTVIWILLWFKMCLGFCFYSGLERPTDWEMIAIITMACYSELPRGGGMPCHAEPMRKQQCWSGDRRNKAGEIIGQILYCGFHGKK